MKLQYKVKDIKEEKDLSMIMFGKKYYIIQWQ